MCVQEVRWGKSGHGKRGRLNFLMGKEKKTINWEQDFFLHHRIISAVKGADSVSDRMPYIVLRAR